MNQPENNKKSPENEGANKRISAKQAARDIYEYLSMFVMALCGVIFIFTLVGHIVTVDGSSMTNTLQHLDRLVVSRIGYEPTKGDIVILRTDAYGDNALVKRVIATEGDVIDIEPETWTVTVNGEKIDEPYIRFVEGQPMNIGKDMYPLEIKKGEMFVMGDNRNGSSDSRMFGTVDVRDCLGKVYFRIFPLGGFGVVE